MREVPREAVDRRHDRVAIGHGERAAGAEIVLHIDHQQDVAVIDRADRSHHALANL